MAMPSGLETRLRAVMADRVNRSAASNRAKTLGACGGALLIVFAALCGAQTAQDPTSEGKQIAISAKFIDVAAEAIVHLPPELKDLAEGTQSVLDEINVEEWLQTKGVDLMSSPTVTTKPGQPATIEVARDFVYPTALEKDGVTPTNFVTEKVGIIVETVATRRKDGSLDLKVHPTVREFEGFTIPSQPGKVFDAKGFNGALKEGDLARPMFIERTSKNEVNVRPGQWVVHGFKTPPDVSGLPPEKQPSRKRVWILVRAEEIDPEIAKAPPKVSNKVDEGGVSIVGAVKRQGKYPFRKGMKLSDLMTEAQGLAPDADPDSIVIKRIHVKDKSASTIYPKRDSAVPLQSGDQVVVGKRLDEATAVPANTRRAKELKVLQVEFSGATLDEAIQFLRRKSQDLDPEKTGVNIVVKCDAESATVRLTLTLKQVSIWDALNYCAQLADHQMKESETAITLLPSRLIESHDGDAR